MTMRHQLIQILATRSVKHGSFTLASGRTSNLYIDARLTTMSPDGLSLIGPTLLNMLHEATWKIDSLGGLTLGADPIAYAIAYASASTSNPIRAFTVRKEAKSHGTNRLIEGPFTAGDQVAVIEDVITTGTSALKAANAITSAGGSVRGIIALIDRQEGGCNTLQQAGYSVLCFTTAEELLAHLL